MVEAEEEFRVCGRKLRQAGSTQELKEARNGFPSQPPEEFLLVSASANFHPVILILTSRLQE